jgi:hypothetical protein
MASVSARSATDASNIRDADGMDQVSQSMERDSRAPAL